jgi:hypothetical protein
VSDFWKAFLKAPIATKVAPFKKREGQPALQGSARSVAHSLLGDTNANSFERKYLGDTADGRRYEAGPTPVPFSVGSAQASSTPTAGGFASLADINPDAAAAAVPGTQPSPAPSPTAGGQRNRKMDELLRRLAMSQGQGGMSGGMMVEPTV